MAQRCAHRARRAKLDERGSLPTLTPHRVVQLCMRRIPIAAIVALTAHVLPAQSATTPIASQLIPLIDSAGIPGLALAFLQNGEIAWTKGFGKLSVTNARPVDPNTVFEAASLSKPVVAYVALKLVDAGLLDLDRPLQHYIRMPELTDPRARLITTRMVLSHTTGLQNERIGDESLALAFTPGEKFKYSGEGFLLLQRALEVVTHESLDKLAQHLVFEPLHMSRTAFIWKEQFNDNAAQGHGDYMTARSPTRPELARAPSSLHTTAHDYALFVRAIMHKEGLKKSTFDQMMTPQTHVASGIEWGLGWSIETSDSTHFIWHWGDNSNSGFTSFVLIDPVRKNAVVYFANSNTGLGIVRRVAALIEGTHAAPGFMGYESYDAPSRKVRLAIEHAIRTEGASRGLTLYDSLKTQTDSSAFPETLLNNLGYRFLSLNRPHDAIALFRRNVELFPQSANAYDSLGDGFDAAGDTVRAIESYDKSYQLDNRNEHARREATRLRASLK